MAQDRKVEFEFLQHLYGSGNGLTVLDETRVVFVNDRACEIFGYPRDELLILNLLHTLAPEDRSRINEILTDTQKMGVRPRELDHIVVRKDGSRHQVRSQFIPRFADGAVVGCCVVTSPAGTCSELPRPDTVVGDRKREMELVERLRRLAGGVAYQYDELLVRIVGSASLLLRQLPPEAPSARRVEDILAAALQAAELTNTMQIVAGKGRFIVEPVNLTALVDTMTRSLRDAMPEGAVLRCQLAEGLPTFPGDATLLRLLVTSLVTNATEALNRRKGVVRVVTSVIEATPAFFATAAPGHHLTPGPCVCLEVSDGGRGMTRRTKARMFDPFYSTKGAGRGLGLAAAQGIVYRHNGAIRVASKDDAGTTVQVVFPCMNTS